MKNQAEIDQEWESLITEIDREIAQNAALTTKLIDKYDGFPFVLAYDNDPDNKGIVITPSTRKDDNFQASYFDKKGFIGDYTRTTLSEVIKEALDRGYRTEAPDLLNRMMQIPSFHAGNTVTLQRELGYQDEVPLETSKPQLNEQIILQKQELLVRQTQEFQEWFGNSKVVDDKGAPLTVYHGTAAEIDFDIFKTTNDMGAHFGTIEQANNRISGEAILNAMGKQEKPLRIFPVHLSIQNPLEVPDTGGFSAKGVAYFAHEKGIISQEVLDDVRYCHNRRNATIKLQKALLKVGYDGIKYENTGEGPGTSYIAFRPEQIKSIHNQGTFDQKNPNILYSGLDPTMGKWDHLTVEEILKPLVDKAEEALPHLINIGKQVWREGYTEARTWVIRMHNYLDDTWDSFKHSMKTVWQAVTKEMELAKEILSNQRDTLTPEQRNMTTPDLRPEAIIIYDNWETLKKTKNLPQNRYVPIPIREYQNQAKILMQAGNAPENLDILIITHMLRHGYKAHEIAKAVTTASPILAGRSTEARNLIKEISKRPEIQKQKPCQIER